MTLNLWKLQPGDQVRMADGIVAEVAANTEDGQWVKVRYIESPEDRSLAGTEDLCHEAELVELLGRAQETR